MIATNQALYEFWSSFEYEGQLIPAYLSGHAPDSASFPYFTFESAQGAYGTTAILTAIVWFQTSLEPTDVSTQTRVAEVLGMVENAIPEGGRWLTFAGGGVLLRRNDASFLSYYNPDEEDNDTIQPVYGGRVSYTAQFFVR